VINIVVVRIRVLYTHNATTGRDKPPQLPQPREDAQKMRSAYDEQIKRSRGGAAAAAVDNSDSS